MIDPFEFVAFCALVGVFVYLALRPVGRANAQNFEDIRRLQDDLEQLRNGADPQFALAVRSLAPPPLIRHFRIRFEATKEIEQALRPDELSRWRDQEISLPEVVIEDWGSHLVVETQFRRGTTQVMGRQMLFITDPARQVPLWEVQIGEDRDWPSLSPRVVLEFDEWSRSLILGPVFGRLGSGAVSDKLLPRTEFQWTSVHLSPSWLEPYRVMPDPEDSVALDRLEWLYECQFADPIAPIHWKMTVRELKDFDAEVIHGLKSESRSRQSASTAVDERQ